MTTLGRREKCLRNRSEKKASPGVALPKPAPPGVAGNTVDQNRAKPCGGGCLVYTASWNWSVKTEIPVQRKEAMADRKLGRWRLVHGCVSIIAWVHLVSRRCIW